MFVRFFVQEERFIFPIFPIFCLNAAIAVCSLPVSEWEGGREDGRGRMGGGGGGGRVMERGKGRGAGEGEGV